MYEKVVAPVVIGCVPVQYCTVKVINNDAADHFITHRVHDFNDASCEINDFPTARTNLRDLAIPMEICVTRQIWCQPRAQRVILQIFYVTRQIWCQPRACNLMFARFTNLREVRSHVPYLLFN